MQAFIELRKRARERRDKAITEARDEYTSTLVRIAALEQDLLGKLSSTHKTIASAINSVIPSDQPFTTHDIMAGLEALDASRDWRMRSIIHHLTRLRERKIVRRLRKAKGPEPALYVRAGAEVTPAPFEDRTMREVVAEMLSDRAMTTTELAVAMLEAGYHTTMAPKALRDAIGVILRRERGRFAKRGGKWGRV